MKHTAKGSGSLYAVIPAAASKLGNALSCLRATRNCSQALFGLFLLFLMTTSPSAHPDRAGRTAGACAWQRCSGAARPWPVLPGGARGKGAKVQLRCEQLEAGICTMRGNWVHHLCKNK